MKRKQMTQEEKQAAASEVAAAMWQLVMRDVEYVDVFHAHASSKLERLVARFRGRLRALGVCATCNRCGGTGHYSYCTMYGSTCFGCSGNRVVFEYTQKRLKQLQELARTGAIRRYFEDAAKRGGGVVNVPAAAIAAELGVSVEALEHAND